MCYVAALKTVAFTRVLIRPPATTPYLLILFYATCVIAALYDLAIDVLDRPVRPGAVIRDASQLCVGSLLVWFAGTYPLQDVWPCPNVAKPGDVSCDLPVPLTLRV